MFSVSKAELLNFLHGPTLVMKGEGEGGNRLPVS